MKTVGDQWLNPDEIDRLEKAYKAGIKEVVEWVNKESWEEESYDMDYQSHTNLVLAKEAWQAQLIVWMV